ncbi:hypothetical protein RI129_009991 [Pyrocoelia pectoralis]|uniref:ADP-ribosylation factor-like protein 6 n=1 Tax=Pyrocoelia pectoralis TaxID=417401 RepID=A0AAN7VCM4_9COLE
MGGLSTVMGCGRKPIEVTVTMSGLSGSGKTTILYKCKLGINQSVNTYPTVSHLQETIIYKNISFNVVDLGGGAKILPYWLRFFNNAKVLIFVIDSSDHIQISEANYYLHSWITTIENEFIVLIYANKQDLPNAMTVPEIIEKLSLNSFKIPWHIQLASAINGEGINEGLDWICEKLII